jgi:triacylglycerol esterase/lipase EstA (alpha/beta hydrolase family)
MCGSADSHSNELIQMVQKVKDWTQHNQVNIVAHSKGGLDNDRDTRWW